MTRREGPGLFIAFEGLDGSGSENHASLLARLLEREGYRVVYTKEPTKSLIGGLIRSRLAGEWKIAPETLQLLFTADRAEHLRNKILPALQSGKIVICNRYIMSALAYNVVLVNDPNWLANLNSRFIPPDLTFLMKVNPKVCSRRVKESKLEIELSKEESKLHRVWKEYERLAQAKNNIYIVDGERDDMAIIDEVSEIAFKYLRNKEEVDNLDKTNTNLLTTG